MFRLLVVEDEERLAHNIKMWFESSAGAIDVSVAGAAENAVRVLNERRFDMLLTDIRLPGMDGIELIRLALECQPHLRVVVMSAFWSPELNRLATLSGALRFLNKPLDLDELYRTLVEVNQCHKGWSGTMGGLDLLDVTQLVALSKKSTVARVSHGSLNGLLAFVQGDLRHAHTASLEGEQAFLAMASWPTGSFSEVPDDDPASYAANISRSLSTLMLDAAQQRDEHALRLSSATGNPEPDAAAVPPDPFGL